MPELPEVETIRRDLAPLVEGREIVAFAVMPGAERLLVGAPQDYVRSRLVGQRIGPLGRRGKYLLLPLLDPLNLRSDVGEHDRCEAAFGRHELEQPGARERITAPLPGESCVRAAVSR